MHNNKKRMWMVECNDHSKDLKISTDSRKLRPLAARSCSSNGGIQQSRHAFSTLLTTPPSCSYFQNPNIHSWNLLSGVKREINMGSVPLVSSRWNPTPEQLQALEEMYRRGLRTPTAEQIQQIASKLRRFGKIEGKNVFYWFQNHKARERQKKRRQLELLPATAKKMRHLETKPTGLDRRSFEIGHPKKLPTLSSCTTPNSQDSESMHGAVIADCRHDGWIPFNQKELQQKIITTEKNENYLQLDLSSLMPPNNSNSTAHKTTAERGLGQGNKNQFGALSLSINDDLRNFESGTKQNQTLQLFPVKGHDLITTLNGFELQEESNQNVSTDPTKFAAKEFIEFLPTRC